MFKGFMIGMFVFNVFVWGAAAGIWLGVLVRVP